MSHFLSHWFCRLCFTLALRLIAFVVSFIPWKLDFLSLLMKYFSWRFILLGFVSGYFDVRLSVLIFQPLSHELARGRIDKYRLLVRGYNSEAMTVESHRLPLTMDGLNSSSLIYNFSLSASTTVGYNESLIPQPLTINPVSSYGNCLLRFCHFSFVYHLKLTSDLQILWLIVFTQSKVPIVDILFDEQILLSNAFMFAGLFIGFNIS